MLIHPWDAAESDDEWRTFVRSQGFGHLVAAGRGRDVPVVVPTQLSLRTTHEGDVVLLHLARPNPVWDAVAENSTVVVSIAGDWAYVPTWWKAIGDEDPGLGVPTTYYAAVQLVAAATVVDDDEAKAEILREQLADTQPEGGHVDPGVHARLLPGIRGLRLRVVEVRAKFKYGGNADAAHRRAVAERLAERGGPGDRAARAHLLRRLGDAGSVTA